MPNPVVHFEVIGKDGQKLQRFYGQVFEWDIKADNPMQYGMISGGDGGGIGGGIGAAPPDMQPHGVTFYIEVANLDETLKQVEKAGIAEVILYFNYGQKPHALVKEQMERFMREVAPYFRR